MKRLEDEDDEEIDERWSLPLAEEADARGAEPHEKLRDDKAEEQSPHPGHSLFIADLRC